MSADVFTGSGPNPHNAICLPRKYQVHRQQPAVSGPTIHSHWGAHNLTSHALGVERGHQRKNFFADPLMWI